MLRVGCLIVLCVECLTVLVIDFRFRGTSSVNDFTLAAEACLPILSAILVEIRKKTYFQNCFLNINVPGNVLNHKVRLGD